MALAGDHRRDAEQRSCGRRPRRERGGIDAGLGDMHPITGQRVQLQQRSSAPRARRDHRRRGREDCALPHAGVAVCRIPAQRHVHERDETQPVRLGHQHLRSRRGDEPVEQREGAVGDVLDDAGERRVRRCVGSRPGARHGVDVHRPAALGERTADPAVVDVASARPGRIVDAVRYDDVHCGHSARSYPADATCDSCSVTASASSSRPASPRAPPWALSASRSAITRASASVEVFMPANAGSSSRFL